VGGLVGHLALAGTLAAAAWTVLAAACGWRGVRVGLWTTAACAVGATGALAWALLTSDFTLAYVAAESRRSVAAPYRLAGLWGGMAGSLLAWTAVVAVVAAVAGRRIPRPAGSAGERLASGAVALVVGALAAIVWLFADPFRRLAAPALDGSGLTPILEHPAMLWHPPLLYAGLALLAAPALLTAAALSPGGAGLDDVWLARCRRWALLPWSVLLVGMVAGAHWAYAELGWGGYWAWDPVENTALLPWLALTAFLHAGRRAAERAGAGRTLPAGLVLGSFALALLGTTLTRSGAAPSVHAFAEDRAIGRALVAVLVVVMLAGAALLLSSARRSPGRPAATADRRTFALAGAVVLILWVLAVVLVGSLAPLRAWLAGGEVIAVGGRFFALFTAPVAVALLVLMGGGPVGFRADRLRGPTVAAIVATVVATIAGWREPFAVAVVAAGAFAATAAVAAYVRDPARPGGHVAHLGAALLLAGIAGTTTGHVTTATVAVGDSLHAGGYEVRNDGVVAASAPGASVGAVRADVTVLRGGREVAHLNPSITVYPDLGTEVAVASVRSTPLDDVHVILRNADDGRALLVVHVNPLQAWVWWGALLLAAGGLLTFIRARGSGVVALPGALAFEEAADGGGRGLGGRGRRLLGAGSLLGTRGLGGSGPGVGARPGGEPGPGGARGPAEPRRPLPDGGDAGAAQREARQRDRDRPQEGGDEQEPARQAEARPAGR
jgi:cytochrome c-type biogenesis protein CcmF